MSEEMPYIPYSEGGGWQKRFEMTIPILILILVIVIVAWKLGWLAGIPIINQFFKSPAIDIAVIGNDADVVRTIETDIRRDLPVNMYVLNKSDLYNIHDASFFNKYSMIILTEGQDGDTVELERSTLEQLSLFVGSGKPAIVVGMGGSKVQDSPQADGWTVMGFVPAACKSVDCEETSVSYDRIKMYVQDINHPMLKEFVEPIEFASGSGQIKYTMVNSYNGRSILDLEITTGESVYSGTALIEGTGSKVIYFAFNPSLYPPLLYNSIKYLR